MSGDIFDHLASLEQRPSPDPGEVPTEVYDEVLEDAARAAYERARELREYWQHHWSATGGEDDPLLDALDDARRTMLEAEQHLRLLIAYGYEFVRPRGYTLAQLATHAGMSISGVRTAYDLENEGRIIEERTGLTPRRRTTPTSQG